MCRELIKGVSSQATLRNAAMTTDAQSRLDIQQADNCLHTHNCHEYEGHAIVTVCSLSVPSIFFLAHMKLQLRTKHLWHLTFLLNGTSLLANMNPVLSDEVIRKRLLVSMLKKHCRFLTV
jgi:hypothetical protein